MASGVQDDSKKMKLIDKSQTSNSWQEQSDEMEPVLSFKDTQANIVEQTPEDDFEPTPVVISCQPEPPPVEEEKTGAKEDGNTFTTSDAEPHQATPQGNVPENVHNPCGRTLKDPEGPTVVGHHSELLRRYDMGSRPRGICVIINNKTFPSKEKRRDGTEKDEEILKKLFTELHFTVDFRRDLTRNEMEGVMELYGRKTDHSRYNAFICIIMSHGKENDFITGVDEKIVRIEDIMAEVDAQHCPSLQNKPKLFFIQSCRGGYHDKGSDGSAIQADSTLPRSVCPTGADFLLAFATTPGYVAWRTSEGTFYIRILADVIDKLHKDVHLLDMLTVVNHKVSEEVFRLTGGKQKQIPAPSFTLRAQVYL